MEGGSGNLRNEPNVVPMIDVLLVLLIIFMLMIPMGRVAIDLQLPDPKPPEENQPPPKQDQIVLEVLPGPQFMINKASVSKEGLPARIKEIFDPRPDKIMFVKSSVRNWPGRKRNRLGVRPENTKVATSTVSCRTWRQINMSSASEFHSGSVASKSAVTPKSFAPGKS
jgi:biopolymer transport protein ExbD